MLPSLTSLIVALTQVAHLDMPKAVILGNHDAWFTLTANPGGRKRPLAHTLSAIELLQQEGRHPPTLSATELLQGMRAREGAGSAASASQPASTTFDQQSAIRTGTVLAMAPAQAPTSAAAPLVSEAAPGPSSSGRPTNGFYRSVEAQMAMLGRSHVGFSSLPVPGQPLAIVGGRPFAKGGNPDYAGAAYDYLYGMSSTQEYADRIVTEATSAVAAAAVTAVASAGGEGGACSALVLMAHNGPFGLGAQAHNICGVDWRPERGDHGDPDLQMAITRMHATGLRLPLVCFGHMHHILHGETRLRGRGRHRVAF